MKGNLNFCGGLEVLSMEIFLGAIAVELASPLSNFFFFFFLATWLLESQLSLGKVEEGDEKTGEEGNRSTLEST